MSPKVCALNLLDGELDAAGSVVHGVTGATVLVVSVLDVVTEQLFVRTRPPHGELLDVRLVLIVIEAGQRGTLPRLTEHLHSAAWRHRAEGEQSEPGRSPKPKLQDQTGEERCQFTCMVVLYHLVLRWVIYLLTEGFHHKLLNFRESRESDWMS